MSTNEDLASRDETTDNLNLSPIYKGTQGISSEMSELRQNLDQSLLAVSTSPKAKLDQGLLDREASRLSTAAERYSRRSPSASSRQVSWPHASHKVG